MVAVKKYIITGLLTIIPLWVVILVIQFLASILNRLGAPLVSFLEKLIRPYFPWVADLLLNPIVSVLFTGLFILIALFFIGGIASNVIGRELFRIF